MEVWLSWAPQCACGRRCKSGCSDGNSNSLEGEEVTGRTLLDFGNWYHLVLVYQVNDHHMAIFVNGEMDGQGNLPNLQGAVSQFQTGFGSIAGKSHTASFDEMALYDRALSVAEIKSYATAFLGSD